MNPRPPHRAALTQPLRKAIGELFFLLARVGRYSVSRFPILTYHSVCDDPGRDVETVAPEDFERQMAWLARRGFQAVTVSELLKEMARSAAKRRLVAITFDDGYRDNLAAALPILQRYDIRATFYIPTAYIDGVSAWNPVDYIGHRPILTAEGIRALSEAGHEIGSHGHHHSDLTLVDGALLDHELGRSKKILEDVTAKPVVAFAPPYGRSNNAVIDHASRLGYTHLVKGGRFTANNQGVSHFDLRRMTIARSDSLREFAKKVSGAYQWASFRDR